MLTTYQLYRLISEGENLSEDEIAAFVSQKGAPEYFEKIILSSLDYRYPSLYEFIQGISIPSLELLYSYMVN